MINVVVIDREAFYIDMVMRTLEGQPDINAVAGVSIYEDFVAAAQEAEIALIQNEPSVALTRSLIRDVRRDAKHVDIIVIGVPDYESIIIDYIAAGAVGYVRDENDVEHMLNVIRIVANGESLAHPELVRPLFLRLRDLSERLALLDGGASGSVAELTPRQREVAGLLAEGMSNEQIARKLHISPGTVKNHIHHILETLQVGDRQRAAAVYRQFVAEAPQERAAPSG